MTPKEYGSQYNHWWGLQRYEWANMSIFNATTQWENRQRILDWEGNDLKRHPESALCKIFGVNPQPSESEEAE